MLPSPGLLFTVIPPPSFFAICSEIGYGTIGFHPLVAIDGATGEETVSAHCF
ncbi:hypothetical protein NBRC111894_3184 [Sporolactobacillus inulinus]|uniref:Uncharacterized protein n=1 Tax=Sporolactobacillus inulinus TaxID=2078 RepID=A0A4Y1ZFB2_9BACL|nr:hypothetical protein NBRC111894_3184 [Sporolactobacillus inulinus]